MQQQDGTAFNRALLRRVVNMMGLFPVGSLVRLNTGELAVVMREHPDDPFRPQIQLIQDANGHNFEQDALANTWEPDERGELPLAIIGRVDPQDTGIEPQSHLEHGSDGPR